MKPDTCLTTLLWHPLINSQLILFASFVKENCKQALPWFHLWHKGKPSQSMVSLKFHLMDDNFLKNGPGGNAALPCAQRKGQESFIRCDHCSSRLLWQWSVTPIVVEAEWTCHKNISSLNHLRTRFDNHQGYNSNDEEGGLKIWTPLAVHCESPAIKTMIMSLLLAQVHK